MNVRRVFARGRNGSGARPSGSPPRLLFAWLLGGLLASSGAPAAAKEYAIPRVEIEARLDATGALDVSEARTYAFKDRFRYAYRTLPLREGVDYAEVGVFEGEQAYAQGDDERPGTYRTSREGDELEVRWFFSARDETRTFTLRYRLTGGLRLHDDAAVLYCQFIGPEWRKPSREVVVRVHPPAPVDAGEIRHWWHGPLWASATTGTDGTLTATCERLPSRTFLEVRALYPPRLFPGAPALAGSVGEEIAREEARWAEEANQRRASATAARARRARLERLGRGLSILAASLGIFGWLLLYQRYGRRGEASGWSPPAARGAEGPAPAFVDYLMHGRQVSAQGLVATLLDLARRGYLTLREERIEKRRVFGGVQPATDYRLELHRAHYQEGARDLLAHEAALLRFLFEELFPGAQGFSLGDLQKRHRQFAAFFGRWSKGVKTDARALRYYDPESVRGMHRGLALGIVMIVLGFGAVFLCGPWAMILIGAGILTALLSLTIVRRTPGGEAEYRRFRVLRDTLKGHAARGGLGGALLDRIDITMIHGLVLGLGAKRMQALAASLPSETMSHHFPWFVAGKGSSPVSFAGSFSAMVAAAGSTMSSASGAGGGASGGGGGGAGGGGGGAG